jgi:hypothetical protein
MASTWKQWVVLGLFGSEGVAGASSMAPVRRPEIVSVPWERS